MIILLNSRTAGKIFKIFLKAVRVIFFPVFFSYFITLVSYFFTLLLVTNYQLLYYFIQLLFQLLYFSYFFSSGVSYPQLTLQQLIQPDLESRFIFRSQLGPSIQSGSSPYAGLQVVTQSIHLSKDCYPKLVLNPHRSEIQGQ